MSKRDPHGPLLDMREYAQKAVRIASGLTLAELRANEVVQLALERVLEVIGEAENRVPQETQDQFDLIPWRAIVGLRNILAHAYDNVRDEVLLNIVHNELPNLIAQLDIALGTFSDSVNDAE